MQPKEKKVQPKTQKVIEFVDDIGAEPTFKDVEAPGTSFVQLVDVASEEEVNSCGCGCGCHDKKNSRD